MCRFSAALVLALSLVFVACGADETSPTDADRPPCGDGVVQAGETCDDGNNRGFDGCGPTCQVEFCGDGIAQLDEECDDGDAMVAGAPDVCRPGCVAPRCGDTIVDAFEACDDGNNVDGDGCAADCSVRTCRLGEDVATLQDAVSSRQCSPILVPAGVFVGGAVIGRDQVIVGEGPGVSILDGGGTERVIDVQPGATVTLRGLTIQNGTANQGGGIWNGGTLRAESVEVRDNEARGDEASGAGIYTRGPVTLTDCVVHSNVVVGDGEGPARAGGLYSLITEVVLQGTIVRDNRVEGSGGIVVDGGGIYVNRGTLTADATSSILSNTVVSESGLASGGGLASARGTVTLTGTAVRENGVETGDQGLGGGLALNDVAFVGDALALSDNRIDAAIMLGAGMHAVGSTVRLEGGAVASNVLERDGFAELARGAGLYLEETPTTLASMTIEQNRIAHGGQGAGLYVLATRTGTVEVTGSDVSIVDNRIEPVEIGRTTAQGAGVFVRAGEGEAVAQLALTDSRVEGNAIRIETEGAGFGLGAGVYAEAAFGAASTEVRLTNTDVRANVLEVRGDTAVAQGAGVFAGASDDRATTTVVLDRARITANTASTDGDDDAESSGAGVYAYAVQGQAVAEVIALSAVIADNRVDAQGGPGAPVTSIRAWGAGGSAYGANGGQSVVELVHTTVVENRATAAAGTSAGGGFHLYSATDDAATSVVAQGAIISANDAEIGAVCHVQVGEDRLVLRGPSLLGVDATCAVDASAGTRRAGDEAFVDASGAWRPVAEGDVVDQGTATTCVAPDGTPLALDNRGEARRAGAACDLGAVELR